MESNNSGLLIAALVAIVAVVGLVILFKGGSSGASVCPPGQEAYALQNPGMQAYIGCSAGGNSRVIPQQVGVGTPSDPAYDTFQNPMESRQRRLAIGQGTWQY